MDGATPESQAPVVARALASYGFKATVCRKHYANMITLRGAKTEDRGHVYAIAKEFAKGFDIDVRLLQTYWIVSIHKRGRPVKHAEVPPVNKDGYDA